MTHDILATGHIDFWLLAIGLVLPRFALFLAAIGVFPYPVNPLPDIANFVLWLIFPRFLMAFYIYTDIGYTNVWFWAYVVLGLVGFMGETSYTQRRIVRRKTVRNVRTGDTVTTIEEEEVE